MSLRPSPWNSRPGPQRLSDLWRAVTTTVGKSPGKILGTALGVVIVVAVTVGGLGFAQDQGQSGTVDQFCTDLKAQNYVAAYGLLSASVRGQFSDSTHFQQVMGILDTMTVSGKVTDCHLNEPTRIPWIGPSSNTGSRFLLIHRQVSGDLQGRVQMKQEDGAWKVDRLDESLLTVSLNAVATAVGYCDDLKSLDFGNAYLKLGSQAHTTIPGATTQLDFTLSQILHYVVDGQITSCDVTSIVPGNSNTATSLGMRITRANADTAEMGNIGLAATKNTWLIDTIDSGLQGTDIGPLQVGYQLCDDVAKGASGLQDAYNNLLSSGYRAQLPSTAFAKLFPSGMYRGCLPDFSTYKPSQSTASFSLGIKVLGNPSATPPVPPSILHIALGLAVQDGKWVVTSIVVTT